MLNFDFIDAASFGYRAVWLERRYLLRLALIPILIKFACTVGIFALGYETDFIRQALITLPASFAEGWLMAQFLRTILLLERWPIILKHEPSEPEIQALFTRARGIMACTILYVLINFVDYGFKAIAMKFYEMAEPAATGNNSAAASQTPLDTVYVIPILAGLVFAIWAFRLLWLYIPVVVLMRISLFLRLIGGYMTSLRMLGLFMICVMPCALLTSLATSLVVSVFGGAESNISQFLVLLISVIVETIAWLIATASMAYAFRDILPKHPKALPDIKNEN